MPNVYVLLGDGNTRKSSTARALTGVPQRKSVSVATTGGNIEVFVQIKSLQEAHISPQDFIQEANNAAYSNVLVPLWISNFPGPPSFPHGAHYIQDFLNANWHIQAVVALGVGQLPQQLPAPAPIPQFLSQSMFTPVNQTSAAVRGWWGWV